MSEAVRQPQGLLRDEAIQAARDGVWGVIQEHKRLGMPLVLWRDGKVAEVPPEEAEAELLAETARAERDGSGAPED